ncbi:MAG: hypothetical protein GXP54_07785 [Deltaproteobacteria bacterium]|nr:hypothetical protein [Deltaproteobacteria bacterium]
MKGLRKRAAKASRDQVLSRAVVKACDHTLRKRSEALAKLDEPQAARTAASKARSRGLDRMDDLLTTLQARLEKKGVRVFRAADREHAIDYVVGLVRDQGLSTVVKAKSMTGEEAGLSRALEDAGCRVVETDLGEYIVQLRDEPPSHIIAPAIHLSRRQVGELFAERLGMTPTEDPASMCDFARKRLRRDFLSADLGIVGVNLAVAGTGDLITVTNEGNGRLCQTMPRVLVAFTGIEKVVEDAEDAAAVLRVLSKNGTGQVATSYVSLLRGPAGPTEPFGPKEIHLVLMDNGRSRLRDDPILRDMLKCIRCGACINCCPVYRSIGGHAYGTTYVGPMGITLTNGLAGGEGLGGERLRDLGELTYACTLCGECGRVCPVGIDLPDMILKLRARAPKPPGRNLGMKAGRVILGGSRRFSATGRIAGTLGRIAPHLYAKLARMSGWTRSAAPPVPSDTPFRRQFRKWKPFVGHDALVRPAGIPAALEKGNPRDETADISSVGPAVLSRTDATTAFAEKAAQPFDAFISNFRDVRGEVASGTLTETLDNLIQGLDHPTVLASEELLTQLADLDCRVLNAADPELPLDRASQAVVGVTGCLALVAETGSILLEHGPGSERAASLLPDTHVIAARADQVVATMEQALAIRNRRDSPAATLITGPSRTADIEKTLIIGMHGPRRLVLVLL